MVQLRRLRGSLALLMLGVALAGCANERASYVVGSPLLVQPTPDRTVDAIIRGQAQAASASTPLPTVVAQPFLATQAARQIQDQPVAPRGAATAGRAQQTPAAAAAQPTAAPRTTQVVPTATASRPALAPTSNPPTARPAQSPAVPR